MLAKLISSFDNSIAAYRFNEAADKLYQFIWNFYCDWYLEFIKPDLDTAIETRKVAPFVLHEALGLLNPIMPFITEELNKQIFDSDSLLISLPNPIVTNLGANDTQISMVIDLISEIRAIRSEMNIPLSSRPDLLIRAAAKPQLDVIESMRTSLVKLARINNFFEIINFSLKKKF